ncbi:MAG: LysR family transcriptional regulator [Methyloceanibacter sp.]
MKATERISRRVKLHHLKVVLAVAEWGSMAKAAKQLSISQPVVSKTVADLEDVLGVRLFDRSPQGVEPTLYGRALLKRSVGIFDDLNTSVDEIRFLSDPAAGELRLGSTEPLLAGLVTAAMERLWRRHPRIALRVTQADSSTLINRDLPERRIELAVIPVQQPFVRSDLDAEILYDDTWHVVAGAKSRWARRRKIALSELASEPWCATPLETSIGSLLADAFRASGLEAPRLTVSSVLSPHLVARFLEDGRLVAVMADSLLNFFYAKRFSIRKLPVQLPMQRFSIAAVTVRNRTISPVAQLFVDCARDVSKELEARRTKSEQMAA